MLLRAVSRHRCAYYAILGTMVGCAAYAADEPTQASGGAEFGMMMELVKAGGLPAVLGFLGWMFGKGGIPVTIQLSETDRKLLERRRRNDQE